MPVQIFQTTAEDVDLRIRGRCRLVWMAATGSVDLCEGVPARVSRIFLCPGSGV